MGLFAFIKNLFVKAEQIESSVEKFVNEVEVTAPEAKKVTDKVKTGIAKAKKVTKQGQEIATQNETAINVVESVAKSVKAKKPATKK
jgi:hypothetical protein